MKNIFSLLFVGLFICCTSNVKKEVDSKTNNLTSESSISKLDEVICGQDSLVKILLKKGIKIVRYKEFVTKPNINFSSGYSDDFSFTQYLLSYKENNIKFIDTIYDKKRSKIDTRKVYLNNVRLNVCRIKNNKFVLNSMEMQIVYTESEIYTFKNNPFYLLVVSHPMNWVGTMTAFSFFQLINTKEKTVIEFIREEG